MQINYQLTQRDFTESYAAHRNRNVFKKWSRRLFMSIVGLSTGFILFGFLIKPSVQMAKDLMPLFGLVLMWFGVLWVLPGWMMRRQFVKQPGAHGPRTLLLDASGAHWRWDGGSSDVEWRNYIQSVEGKNQFLLYTSPACFNILPKRDLNPDQSNELRTLLAQNIRAEK